MKSVTCREFAVNPIFFPSIIIIVFNYNSFSLSLYDCSKSQQMRKVNKTEFVTKSTFGIKCENVIYPSKRELKIGNCWNKIRTIFKSLHAYVF